MIDIQLNTRLKKIIEIVKADQPITGDQIAKQLSVTRSALRPDLTLLTLSGILGAKPKVGYFYIGMETDHIISKKLNETKVDDIMSPPTTVTSVKTVYDTIVTMFTMDVGSIMVTSNDYLSGIISRKDLLKLTIGGSDIHNMPVSMVMTRMPNLIMIEKDDPASLAASKMIEHEIDSLPVVSVEVIDKKNHFKVIGRVTKTSITRLFVDLSN